MSPFFYALSKMPIERCQRNDEEGWRGFPDGKCYLASEEGSDDEAKKRAIDQAIAAGIPPEEFEGHKDKKIEEYADIVNLEVFKPGKHNGMKFSDEMLDEIVASTAACMPIIEEGIKKGEYPGNPGLNAEIKRSGKPIPALINLGHQRYLEPIKDFLKNVKANFLKVGDSILANLSGIDDSVALALKEVFPGRSIELIKQLYNPRDGKTYHNVIRSIGFLPHNMTPAVAGMNENITVEFSQEQDSNFLLVYSLTKEISNQEDNRMPEKVAKKTEPMVTGIQSLAAEVLEDKKSPPEVSISEFEALKSQVEVLEKEKLAQKELLEKQLRQQEHELDEQKIEMYCKDLAAKQIKGTNGHEYLLSQAVIDLVKPVIAQADCRNVLPFSDEKNITMREAVKQLVSQIIEMAANNSLLAPIGGLKEFKASYTPPEETQEPKPMHDMIMEFYGTDGKDAAKNPDNEHEVYLKAMDAATRDNYSRISTGGK